MPEPEGTAAVATEPVAAPETAAPASTPETAPSTPDANLSDTEFISQWIDKQGKEESAVEPVSDDAQVPPAEVTPEEQPPAEEPATEEQPKEEAKQEENVLDLDEPLAPRDLEAKIKANPELQAAIDKDPSLRNSLFKDARLAQETVKYKEIFPDIESAKEAALHASTWREAEAAFQSGPESFIGSLLKMATITDENGNPVRTPEGYIKTDPALTRFLDHVGNREFEHRINTLRTQAERSGDDELSAALSVLMERTSPNRSSALEQDPRLKAERDALEADKQAWTRQQAERQQAAREQYEDEVFTEAGKRTDDLVSPLLDKAALTDFAKTAARKEIAEALDKALEANSEYQSRLKSFERLPMTAETKQKQVGLMMNHVQAVLPSIVREVLRKAANPVIKAQQEKQAKVAAQTAASKSELKGSKLAATQKPLEGAELMKHLEAEYAKANNGAQMPTELLLTKVLEYKNNLRAAARR